jgi:glycosyltransferase involved in cell wall biosynthesis
VCEVLAVSLAQWSAPGTVKSFAKNSSGRQHGIGGIAWSQVIVNRLQFITAMPSNIRRGSGCYVGTRTLVEGLRGLGTTIEIVRPQIHLPFFTATRLLFNEAMRWRDFSAGATIGIDADGYAIAGKRNSPPHIACIKGVIGDAVRFEAGVSLASMAFHSRLEAKNARRADLVITISRYCAERIADLYGVKGAVVVPEVIDLTAWRHLFNSIPIRRDLDRFTVLSVCRFYPRKRLDILLRAAAQLRQLIPQLEIRIVGNGPQYKRLQGICAELRLDGIVHWLGDLPLEKLAQEYKRAHVFCLPSLQEGFGIVFLEAMAAGKPIVAVRASAVPEVVQSGILVEPDNPEALADGIIRLYRDPYLCSSLAFAACRDVEQFDVHRIARLFLSEVAKVAPEIAARSRTCEPIQDCIPAGVFSQGR